MKNKRLAGALVAVTIICALCAGLLFNVSLAKSQVPDGYEDKLIGVFVTDEYVSTFDFDGFVKENAGVLKNGDVTIPSEDLTDYQDRIYAVKTTDGSEMSDGATDYYFDGIKGLRCFMVSEKMLRTVEDYSGVHTDDSYYTHVLISDMECDSSVNVKDGPEGLGAESTETVLNCNIYAFAGADKDTAVIYCNPVYQDSEGNVYMVSGQGVSSGCGEDSVGLTLKLSVDNLYEETDMAGHAVTDKTTVNVQLNVVSQPVSYTVTQYDEDDVKLERRDFAPASIPAEYMVSANCAYVMITENYKDGHEKRSLADKEAPKFIGYEASDDSYASKKECTIVWP